MKKMYRAFVWWIVGGKVANRIVHSIIISAMKRRVIDSKQAHTILGDWNRAVHP